MKARHPAKRLDMLRIAILLPALCLISTLLAGCESKEPLPETAGTALLLSSTAFQDEEEIPDKYTCQGQDISPPLAWSQPPAGTQSLAEAGKSLWQRPCRAFKANQQWQAPRE